MDPLRLKLCALNRNPLFISLSLHLPGHQQQQHKRIIEAAGGGKESSNYWDFPFDALSGQSLPVFDNGTQRDVIATVGQTAYLNCRVLNLGDRAVSWIRKRDLHILTIGIMTYTNDQRFQAEHPEGSNDWQLKVSYVQEKDSGIYECQVSTEPKISLAFRLSVVGECSGRLVLNLFRGDSSFTANYHHWKA